MRNYMMDHIGVMIHAIDLDITNYLKHRLGDCQLAPEQQLVLALLMKREGLSQNEIADQLRKDKSGLTRMLGSLEKKGFIERKGCPNDRRCTKVFLTESGRALKQDIEVVTQTTKELLLKGFTEQEKKVLWSLLARLRSNVVSAQRSE